MNISLDSLDRQRYAALARRDRLPEVLAGLAAAEAAGLRPVKVNAVIMRGVNEADVVPLAEFCLERGYRLRFIEQMPLGPRHGWDRAAMVPADEILAQPAAALRARPAARHAVRRPPRIGWSLDADCHPSGTDRRDRLGHPHRSAGPATAPG